MMTTALTTFPAPAATARPSHPSVEEQVSALKVQLSLLGAEYGELLAHARAAVAAAERGEADPVGYVRDVLAEHGQLPAAGALPARLLSGTARITPVQSGSAGCAR
ncbi:hypothetical protein [Nonomuraea typhae]|uniref:Uncharacterized protein n=1 Tax=Nonomuraea typhae TaxID=2603600 RepID=A0ABW7Z695_9ACTN